jgi:hypothetical protein
MSDPTYLHTHIHTYLHTHINTTYIYMYIDIYIYTWICVHFSFLVMCRCCSPLFGSNRAFSSGITKHLGSSAQVFQEGGSNRPRSQWHRAHGDNRTRRVPEDGPPFRVLFFPLIRLGAGWAVTLKSQRWMGRMGAYMIYWRMKLL